MRRARGLETRTARHPPDESRPAQRQRVSSPDGAPAGAAGDDYDTSIPTPLQLRLPVQRCKMPRQVIKLAADVSELHVPQASLLGGSEDQIPCCTDDEKLPVILGSSASDKAAHARALADMAWSDARKKVPSCLCLHSDCACMKSLVNTL